MLWDNTDRNSEGMTTVPECVPAFSLFPFLLLDWRGFTLKVADHLRQTARSNGLNERKPASTSTTQNVGSVNGTLVYCPDTLHPLAMTG